MADMDTLFYAFYLPDKINTADKAILQPLLPFSGNQTEHFNLEVRAINPHSTSQHYATSPLWFYNGSNNFINNLLGDELGGWQQQTFGYHLIS